MLEAKAEIGKRPILFGSSFKIYPHKAVLTRIFTKIWTGEK